MVMLPIALAYGVASGLGPIAGMYCAIAVGFFAAVFGGTRSQISGPTGPMTLATAVILTTHANTVGEAFTIVVIAGLIQIVLGVIRIGQFVSYVPYSVISGFMTGIGIIIILTQVAPFVGAPVVVGGIDQIIGSLPATIANSNRQAIIVAGITLLVGILWPERLRKYLPAPLAAMIAGSVLARLWLTIGQENTLPLAGAVPIGLPELQLPVFSTDLAHYLIPALTLALIGSADSLLNALVADSMTKSNHRPNRELAAQGIGNIATGLIGGLPGSANTAATVVNIRSGGARVAGAFYALIILALALGLGRFVAEIPLAVLAGILVKAGWDIIDRRLLTRARRIRREYLLVMILTAALTVLVDLVAAVAVGLITSAMAGARRRENQELGGVVSAPLLGWTFLYEPAAAGSGSVFTAQVGIVALRGRFSVASSRRLVNVISADIRYYEIVIFDFADTIYMDDSAALAVERMIDLAIQKDTESVVMGLSGPVERNLRALNTLRRVPQERFVNTLDEARAVVQGILKS